MGAGGTKEQRLPYTAWLKATLKSTTSSTLVSALPNELIDLVTIQSARSITPHLLLNFGITTIFKVISDVGAGKSLAEADITFHHTYIVLKLVEYSLWTIWHGERIALVPIKEVNAENLFSSGSLYHLLGDGLLVVNRGSH